MTLYYLKPKLKRFNLLFGGVVGAFLCVTYWAHSVYTQTAWSISHSSKRLPNTKTEKTDTHFFITWNQINDTCTSELLKQRHKRFLQIFVEIIFVSRQRECIYL